jgi:hypothetical protein
LTSEAEMAENEFDEDPKALVVYRTGDGPN